MRGNPSREEAATSAHSVACAAVASGRPEHHGESKHEPSMGAEWPAPCLALVPRGHGLAAFGMSEQAEGAMIVTSESLLG